MKKSEIKKQNKKDEKTIKFIVIAGIILIAIAIFVY